MKQKNKWVFYLLFAFLHCGPILTIFAFLTHFVFADSSLLAIILWSIICLIFYYFLCFFNSKLTYNSSKQSLKKSFIAINSLKFFLVLLLTTFLLVLSIYELITIISKSDTRFLHILLKSTIFTFYCSASIFDIIFLCAKLHIIKSKKETKEKP